MNSREPIRLKGLATPRNGPTMRLLQASSKFLQTLKTNKLYHLEARFDIRRFGLARIRKNKFAHWSCVQRIFALGGLNWHWRK